VSELDAARRQVVEHGLMPQAISELNAVVSGLSLEALGPVKQLLKRYFSDQPWTAADDAALADAIGPGEGDARHELEPGLTLHWSWPDGRFLLRVERDDDLGELFDGPVVPEATPSPRSVRFATPPIHSGPSRVYASAEVAADDPRVARLFREFDDVTNVLVGPTFVAVTIARPDRWESVLAPMLHTVTEEFAAGSEPDAPVERPLSPGAAPTGPPGHEPRRLEQAWADLRADPRLERVIAAAHHDDAARRQAAAALLADAPLDAAADEWRRLLDDPSRVVRRATVDAVAGAEDEQLRPLLEHALDDGDPWTRWKALHGIAALGVDPSRAAVEVRATDPDFRVRLEAARALAMKGA
jgi:HEAT repeat protein/scaffold Nfu/NifU family protein